MKLKVSALNPSTLAVIESKELYLPVIDKPSRTIVLKGGQKVHDNSGAFYKYTLEIGAFKYWLKKTGELIKIEE